MAAVVFQSVRKAFRHRPALFNWVGRERTGETVALDDVSLSVGASEVVALLGPNGSGKTTMLKLISGMLLPDSGSVLINGFDSRREGQSTRREVGIAVAAERSFFPRLSARENLEFFAALDEVPRGSRSERIDEVLDQCGLREQTNTLAMKFSSGMYQRLGIARALAKRPRVLLLDEPTRSLDAAATENLWSMVRSFTTSGSNSQAPTIFVATHNFEEAAELATRLLFLHHGALVADRALADHETAESLRNLYFRLTGEDRFADDDAMSANVIRVANSRARVGAGQ